jgi:hypothetical protein
MRHQPPDRIRIERFPECQLDASWTNVEDGHPPHGQIVEGHTSDCRTVRVSWDRLDQCWCRGCTTEDVVAWRKLP